MINYPDVKFEGHLIRQNCLLFHYAESDMEKKITYRRKSRKNRPSQGM